VSCAGFAGRSGSASFGSQVFGCATLDPDVEAGRPGARDKLIPAAEILVEDLTSVGKPQPCLGKLLWRQSFIVDLHVDVASVERTTDKRYVNMLHNVIFGGAPPTTPTIIGKQSRDDPCLVCTTQ
jgi:hypothetical protein